MKQFRIATGSQVQIAGVRFSIVSRDGDEWRLVAAETQEVRRYSYDDLVRLYVDGQLVGDLPTEGDADGAHSRLLADLPERDQARAEFRLAFLSRVAELMNGLPSGPSEPALQRALDVASAELDHSPPISRPTYYRWKAKLRRSNDVCDLAGGFHDRGRANLPLLVREIAREIWTEAREAASARKDGVYRTTAWLVAEFHKRLALRNAARVDAGQPTVDSPRRSTVYALFTEFPARERDLLHNGRLNTRSLYRSPSPHRGVRPELPLDLVEYDETPIPIFLFDEVTLLPLGRPCFAAFVDWCCDAPTGFYFGFEAPNDLMFASTLRHACLPKTYVADEYPDIVNDYPLHGIARRHTLDNELSAHGGTVDLITKDLLSSIGVAPSRTPWWKPRVEGFFNKLNELLLRELPGYVLHKELSPEEYDPTRNGCLGLRYFMYLFHAWLIDCYLPAPGSSGKSPNQLWQEGMAQWTPDLIARSRDLDLLFGIVRDARLDHRGVVYENLWYHSEELQGLRIRDGHTQHVRVKVNPIDLDAVHVFDATRRLWVRANARDADYASGLSLHRHKLNLKNAAPGPITIQRLREAEARLRELIADAAQVTLSIQTAELAARATGLGTHHIFNHLDIDGHLGPLSGAFEGQRLSPLQGGARPLDPPPHAGPSTEPASRAIPKLYADRSLGHGKSP